MKTAFLVVVLLLGANLVVRAANPYWIRLDRKLIRDVTALVAKKSAQVAYYFGPRSEAEHNLGFGWKARDLAAYGGYLTIKATCYYYHDSLLSYTITPWLPKEPALKRLYIHWLAPGFKVSNASVTPVYYNRAALEQPLTAYYQAYSLPRVPRRLADYMSPASGVEYGYAGGYASVLLPNRSAFLAFQRDLSTAQVRLLLYAVNPASRLTGIEYYLKHKPRFTRAEQLLLEQWIETVFTELPQVESVQGCLGGLFDARELVAAFAH